MPSFPVQEKKAFSLALEMKTPLHDIGAVCQKLKHYPGYVPGSDPKSLQHSIDSGPNIFHTVCFNNMIRSD